MTRLLAFLRRRNRHPVPCRCAYHEGWRAGYLQAAYEAQLAEAEETWRRMLVRAGL